MTLEEMPTRELIAVALGVAKDLDDYRARHFAGDLSPMKWIASLELELSRLLREMAGRLEDAG